jgi:hypothetical protein
VRDEFLSRDRFRLNLPDSWTWWDHLLFKLTPTQYTIDYGYRRVDPSRLVKFKVFRQKCYIMGEYR